MDMYRVMSSTKRKYVMCSNGQQTSHADFHSALFLLQIHIPTCNYQRTKLYKGALPASSKFKFIMLLIFGRHAEVAGVCLMKVGSHILRMSRSTQLHFQTLTHMFSKVLCLNYSQNRVVITAIFFT